MQVVGAPHRFGDPIGRDHLVEARGLTRRARDADDVACQRLEQFADGAADDARAGDRRGLAVQRAPQPPSQKCAFWSPTVRTASRLAAIII